ncbi:hypothetical protein CVD28_18530 [Bacillus sp. M6-12]|uniref:glutamate cyclase domain-containing protein n=1 Tax=Bacillus sp. M6-12 TaxID=2054166 RepID=UPI000C76AEB5|nr:glutamate cyclase domain-containing protein [Bacillus sp. M6-12]PLS16047.1 hypothetical protein CVD28_18530 [Bacillus sp. M6-12]
MKVICENLDRMVTTEIRSQYLPRGVVASLYDAVRQDHNEPITYQIASALKEKLDGKEECKIGIFTGVWHPEYFPNGENDGPIGCVALGKALHLGGAEVIYCVEKEVAPIMEELCKHLQIPANIFSLSRTDVAHNEKLAEILDCGIFIEKLGSAQDGNHHFATGGTRPGQDAPLESMLTKMRDNNKLTIGVGDNGNEIGFGKIHDETKKVVPFNEKVTVMATDYLLPSSVSNIGAYGITAALALVMENLEMLHNPDDEVELIKICAALDCRDGGFGKAHNFVDGISDKSVASVVEIIKEIVSLYYTQEKRGF